MFKKAKNGSKQNVENLDEARADVDNYIRQTADYINGRSLLKEELETSGFDLIEGAIKAQRVAAQVLS
jgi:Holliday junction resolvase RusA-like endonuclease